MKIRMLGTKGEIEEFSPIHKKQSGILIDNMLFDVGEPVYLEYNPKIVFITHLHPDHAFFVKEKKIPEEHHGKFYIVAPEKVEGLQWEDWKVIKFGEDSDFCDYTITPFPTLHSKKVKSLAYLVEGKGLRVLYTGDMIWLKKKYHDQLKNLDLVITDGSFLRKGGMIRKDKKTGEVYGHQGIPDLIKFFSRLGAKHIIFTHFGTEIVKDHKEAERKVKELAKESNIDVRLAKDGITLNITKKKIESLQGEVKVPDIEPILPKKIIKVEGPKRGLYLVPPHARWIAQGKKTIVVKKKKFEIDPREPLYLIEDNICWGHIFVGEAIEIGPKDFKQLQDKHLVSDEERKKWWGEEFPLYAYNVKAEPWAKPRIVEIPKGIQTFVDAENIKFKGFKELSDQDLEVYHAYAHKIKSLDLHSEILNEFKERNFIHPYSDWLDRLPELLISDWKRYDPKELIKTKRGKKILGDDHRIVHAWWKLLEKGKTLKSEQFAKFSLTEQRKII